MPTISISISDVTAVAATALALMSFFFNWLVVRRQESFQIEALRMQLDSWIVDWGRRTLANVANVIVFVESGGLETSDRDAERLILKSKISSNVDEGRFFFANINADVYASSAEPEQDRGDRHPILDALAFIERILVDPRSRSLSRGDVLELLRHCNGLFYTQIQWSIDPRARAKMLRRFEQSVIKARPLQDKLARQLESMLPGTLKRFRVQVS